MLLWSVVPPLQIFPKLTSLDIAPIVDNLCYTTVRSDAPFRLLPRLAVLDTHALILRELPRTVSLQFATHNGSTITHLVLSGIDRTTADNTNAVIQVLVSCGHLEAFLWIQSTISNPALMQISKELRNHKDTIKVVYFPRPMFDTGFYMDEDISLTHGLDFLASLTSLASVRIDANVLLGRY